MVASKNEQDSFYPLVGRLVSDRINQRVKMTPNTILPPKKEFSLSM